MVHATLLLLMLEAANARPRFTISLKRSTQNLQLSTSRRPITPSLHPTATIRRTCRQVQVGPVAAIFAVGLWRSERREGAPKYNVIGNYSGNPVSLSASPREPARAGAQFTPENCLL